MQFNFKSFTQIVILVAYFLDISAAVNLTENTSPDLLNFPSTRSAISFIFRMSDSGVKEFTFRINGDLVALYNTTILQQRIKKPENSSTLRKRWSAANAKVGMTWMEFHTLNQRLIWHSWQPASCVHQNHGKTPVIVPVSRSVTNRGTWNTGFNPDFGMISSREIGRDSTKKHVFAETAWYTVSPKGYGQVWAQQLVIRQQQQRRNCKLKYFGRGGIECSAWSVPISGTLPVIDGLRFEWRTDWKMMDFKNCGGGD